MSKQTGTQVNLDNARTAAAAARAAIMGDQAQIENLNVQLSWYTIKAPITGRVSTFSLKAGNIVRSGNSTYNRNAHHHRADNANLRLVLGAPAPSERMCAKPCRVRTPRSP